MKHVKERKRRHDDVHFPMGGRGKRGTPNPATFFINLKTHVISGKIVRITTEKVGISWGTVSSHDKAMA